MAPEKIQIVANAVEVFAGEMVPVMRNLMGVKLRLDM